jgi:putative DNA primase/helicase
VSVAAESTEEDEVTEEDAAAIPAETVKDLPKQTPKAGDVPSDESAKPTDAPQATRPRGLPTIVITDKQLREVTEDALYAIHAANDPPWLFERGGVLTQLHVKDSVPTLEALSREALRGHLARVADWKRKVGKVSVACYPPMPVVADVQALSSWRDIPPLKEVIEAPIFAADGSLVTDIGYHAGSKLYFAGETGLVIPSVSMSPSNADIKEAVGRLDELFADFPFKDDSSRAHAFALTLLPFARELVDGLTPLHLIDAPSAGTGKGLLAEVVSIPAMGRGPDVMTEGRDEDEWRKRITAALVKGARFLLIDNLRRRLDSGQLAGALTATPAWTDRLLGHSLTVTIPVRCVWVATGNNVSMSNEMSRRAVWIRLDAKKEAPWTRSASSFRHPLPGWARENRGQLIHACLTIIQGWLAAGRPKADKSLGRFESWAEVIGGILAFAGVKGFLSNANELYSRTDDETRPWREFVQCWWETHGNKVVGAEQLYDLATAQNLLSQVLGDNGDRSQRTRLGIAPWERCGIACSETSESQRAPRITTADSVIGSRSSPSRPRPTFHRPRSRRLAPRTPTMARPSATVPTFADLPTSSVLIKPPNPIARSKVQKVIWGLEKRRQRSAMPYNQLKTKPFSRPSFGRRYADLADVDG